MSKRFAREAATAAQAAPFLRETAAPSRIIRDSSGKYLIRIIVAGQGSSGSYDGSVLERDVAQAFPKGTRIYMDHSTAAESNERPERSVKDIGGYTTADAYYQDGAAYAPVQFGGKAKEIVDDFYEVIGMSINASADFSDDGEEVVRIKPHPFNSIDLVTVPGAGGAIVEKLTESLKAFGSETTVTLAEDEQENGDALEIKELADKVDSLASVVNSLAAAKATEAQAKVDADAVSTAVSERLAAIDSADTAIEAADLLPSQAKALRESARRGEDITHALESAKTIATEARESVKGDQGDGFVSESGSFVGGSVKSANDFIPKGW